MRTMFCSVIIPTIGRPTLQRAVWSALRQTGFTESVEVIVVNDAGIPLPGADWQQSEQVQIINVNRRERSVARNVGATLAKGRYLLFLDDDDWLAPDALKHFCDLASQTDAAWLYGSSLLVDRHERPLVRLDHQLSGNCFAQTMAGEWIPLQASMVETLAFFAVGGFNTLITGPEDIDLLRRISLHGDLAETTNVVAYLERDLAGSTTDYDHHPRASRWARERILNNSGVLARLRGSARSSRWHGRILRIYLTSVIWNLRRKRLTSSASRLLSGLTSLMLAGPEAISFAYWRAVFTEYRSDTFARGLAEVDYQP